MASHKICSYCRCSLPLESFAKDKTKEDGKKHICRGCSSIKSKEWLAKHPDYRKKQYNKNKDRERAKIKEYYETHKVDRVAQHKKRRRQDPQYRLAIYARSRIRAALHRGLAGKGGKTSALLGCSIVALIQWLSYQFEPGMTWENYGTAWHVDHVRPLSSFDLTSVEQQYIAFHWTNLQPLWAKDNLSKGGRWPPSTIDKGPCL